jgi:hypothetical protein
LRRPESGAEPYISFSERIRQHPAIAVTSSHDDVKDILAVTDQILVCFLPPNEAPLILFKKWCKKNKVHYARLTTVFHGLLLPPGKTKQRDATIYKLIFPRFSSIFDVVKAVRHDLHGQIQPGQITPNHVLVPATYENHSCPSGPPKPYPPPVDGLPPPPLDVPPRRVTVIDSGYQWWGNTPNPLGPKPPLLADTLNGGAWVTGEADVLNYAGGTVTLDALAGHANFIAGIIRQLCPQARVTIRNHNGGFSPDSDDIPTEAAVARSLYQSAGAEVIDLGFAFVTFGSQISWIWGTALTQVGPGTPVVAPAGNQGVTAVRYPAALSQPSSWHAAYPNLISAASIGKSGRSQFSNYGPWITCSTRGEEVVSTFLAVTRVPEDLVTTNNVVPPPSSFQGWAQWNGTSFAAPRVVGAIANVMGQTGGDGLAAWNAIISNPNLSSSPDLGYLFP